MTRRNLIISAGVAASAAVVVAARLAEQYDLVPPDSGGIYGPGETLTYAAQRLLTGQSLAREFPPSKISKAPYPNGKPPADELFTRQQANHFADWRLSLQGMVARPATYSLADLRALPSKSQITQLACEEGWSYIAQWDGVPLSHLLHLAGVLPQARYVVYESVPIKSRRWDSLDLAEAMHPQTLITYGMNGAELPVGHGGPLRLRVPRQLGYKSIKFMTTITVTDNLNGRGSSAANEAYSWYAGI